MKNLFKYSSDNKRYHTYNYYLKNKYQNKIAKIGLNADFTCPNRDGRCAKGGCTFCSSIGSGEFAGNTTLSLFEQYEKGKEIMSRKWPNCDTIAYFQSFTNTYGSVEKLKKTFEPFVNYDRVKAIHIATRADCLEPEIINYLADLNQRIDLTIELGLQTIHDKTAKLINRGHDFATFKTAVKNLRKHKIDVCVHLMNGLPYETEEMMLESIKEIAKLDIQQIKIHLLYIIKNTKMANDYLKQPFELLSREKYIEIVVKQLELLPETVVVQRLTGDPIKEDLIAPTWAVNKRTILNDIDKLMVKLNTYQGAKYEQSNYVNK